ncbi:MAG TPA: transcriptional regulator [Acidimicrobiales bacterium]|nr:transcriptional regulator [Acidimicrobiales bacterium]
MDGAGYDEDRTAMVNQTVLAEEDEQEEAARAAYARAVGSRLRAVRKQMRLSLQAVEAMSDQEFKASVLGAYERGERAISVPRLQRLAKLYDVPVDQLLPQDDEAVARWGQGEREGNGHGNGETPTRARRAPRPWDGNEKVTIDLTKLNSVSGPERDLLRRFLSMIQVQRQDFNGRMITIRAEDLRAIACLFGVTPDAMSRRLDELGLRVSI